MSRDLSAKPLVLALGAVAGAIAVLALGRRPGPRRSEGGESPATGSALLTGDHRWAFETSAVVHRTAGEVALHVHEKVDLPGLRGPLQGPPMDRVEWQGPGGATMRLQIHPISAGTASEIMLQVAPGEGSAPTAMPHGLESDARKALGALRSAIER